MVAPRLKRLIFHPAAGAELTEAADWYEARGKGLGADLLRAVDARLAAIQRRPGLYPTVYKTARRVLLRRFPYSLIYVVSDDTIRIIACAHGRRDPRRWQMRV
jgi:plasmid stabilization system protein ParE